MTDDELNAAARNYLKGIGWSDEAIERAARDRRKSPAGVAENTNLPAGVRKFAASIKFADQATALPEDVRKLAASIAL